MTALKIFLEKNEEVESRSWENRLKILKKILEGVLQIKRMEMGRV